MPLSLYKQVKGRLALFYGSKARRYEYSPFFHPIGFVKKNVNHKGADISKVEVAATVANCVRIRMMYGPELNIMFLGIPFAVQLMSDYTGLVAQEKVASYKTKRAAAAAAPPAVPGQSDETVRVSVGSKKMKKGGKKSSAGSLQPLTPSPHSDKALGLRDELVDAGMSVESATLISEGGFEGQELSGRLPPQDEKALAGYLLERVEAVDQTI